jgi:3-dehydroquinate synthetase
MMVAAQVAAGRGLIAEDENRALKALVMRLGPLPPVADLPADRVLDLVKRDKKVVDGSLHFVLLSGLGTARIVDDLREAELLEGLVAVGFRQA